VRQAQAVPLSAATPARGFRFSVFALCCGAALSYPISALIHWRDVGFESLRNELAFTVYLPFIFPLAVAVFFTAFDPGFLRRAARSTQALLLLALVAFVLIIALAVIDGSRRPLCLAPYMLQDSKAAATMQQQLRSALYSPHDSDFRTNDQGLKLASSERQTYLQKYPPFRSFSDQAQRGSITSWVALALNLISTEFAIFYLWYLGALVVLRARAKPAAVNDLVLVFALLVLWLPLRLYSDWYANFYDLDLEHFGGFIVSVPAAFIAIVLLVGLIRPNASTRVFSVSSTILVALMGAIAKIKPEWLWDIGNAIEHLDPAFFLCGELMVIFAVVIFVALIVQGQVDAAGELIGIGAQDSNDGAVGKNAGGGQLATPADGSANDG